MADLLDKLNEVMDLVEPATEKVAKALSQVHVPGKEYPSESHDAIDAEIVSEEPPMRIVFGGVPASDGRGIVWHAYANPDAITICGRRHQPETWWRPNPSSRQAILFCFGCLSRLAEFSPKRKEITDGR